MGVVQMRDFNPSYGFLNFNRKLFFRFSRFLGVQECSILFLTKISCIIFHTSRSAKANQFRATDTLLKCKEAQDTILKFFMLASWYVSFVASSTFSRSSNPTTKKIKSRFGAAH